MPGVGAIYRYFGALSVSCKLLKKSNLQFLPQESRKLFTVFSQNWMAEIHTRANQTGTIPATEFRRIKARFEHRMLRLERKAGRTLLDVCDAWPHVGRFVSISTDLWQRRTA